MKRLFDEHVKRRVRSLDGAWKFAADPENIGKTALWQTSFRPQRTVAVPSVFGTYMGLENYRGAAWYRKDFNCDCGVVRIHFGAALTFAEVWLDGELLGSHYGYCEFDFITRIKRDGNHNLTVRVDNSFDSHSVPRALSDWYHHGGIPRSVTLEYLQGVTVVSNKMHYTVSSDLRFAEVKFDAELYNASEQELTANVKITLGALSFLTPPITVAAGERARVGTAAMRLENIKLWSPEAPELYTLTTETETDDLIDRVGFRRIETSGNRILLNGKPLQIKGVNRHEEYPECGIAVTEQQMLRDLDIHASIGLNAIRGAHYPNARPFVDMLDERGILFWSEIPVWGKSFSDAEMNDPIVTSRIRKMHEEMIDRYYNHPSIVIWGMHNEIDTPLASVADFTESLYAMLKEKGGGRLVTYATDRPFGDMCFKHCDFVSVNDYHGWYVGGIEDWPEFIDKLLSHLSEQGFGDKPLVISEFGAAALLGTRDFAANPWSEDHQSKLITTVVELVRRNPAISGFYVWHFADARTTAEMGLNRARGINNKGILTEYRKPKNVYYALKDLLGKDDK